MRIDSHQHFWNYDPIEYPWIKPEWPIRRTFAPADLEIELKTFQFDGCVAVQARQSEAESSWLLQLAEQNPFIKGVVGWVDLRAPDVATRLAQFAAHPKFVGMRHVLQDEEPDFITHPDFQRGIGRLREFNLKYDLLIFPKHLPAAIELVSAFPEQPFVLDHIAKPSIRTSELEPWRKHIRELAARPNVHCKVSAMITEAEWNQWRPEQFRPYLDVVFEAFGVDRLMYGSDWPVALLAGTYRQAFELAHNYVKPLGADAEAKFFGVNAANFYHLR